MRWTKETAVAELNKLIEEITTLKAEINDDIWSIKQFVKVVKH